MKTTQTVLETVRAIAQGRCPVESFDIVEVGKACREAEAAGYIRTYHGCFPDWGAYKVTEAGHKLLTTGLTPIHEHMPKALTLNSVYLSKSGVTNAHRGQ